MKHLLRLSVTIFLAVFCMAAQLTLAAEAGMLHKATSSGPQRLQGQGGPVAFSSMANETEGNGLSSVHRGLLSGISLQIDAGWNSHYRTSPTWTPVRVTIRNVTGSTIRGTAEIPDTSIVNAAQSGQPSQAIYAEQVTLPAGSTKHVTLYVPGADINSQVRVTFTSNGRSTSPVEVFPTAFDDRDITIGVLSGDPSTTTWLQHVQIRPGRVFMIPLTSATLDPVPEALATFDEIVVTNVNSARLSPQQLTALERYVRNGGSLVLVGGLDWEETLRPLPPILVPGHLLRSIDANGLSGLRVLGSGAPPSAVTALSLMVNVRGAVLAAQNGLPLVVRRTLGNGTLEYLAFDPAIEPLRSWSQGGPLFSSIITGAAAQAMRRVSLPASYGSVSFLKPPVGPLSITRETTSSPAKSVLVILMLAALVAFYIVLAGPVTFFGLRQIRRPGLSWIVVPALAISCVPAFGIISSHTGGAGSVVSTVGMVEMDGSPGAYPATLYVGLSEASSRSNGLALSSSGLVSPNIPYTPSDLTIAPHNGTSGWFFYEGSQTRIFFPPTETQTARTVTVRTTAGISGDISPHLVLNSNGDITGSIVNNTSLTVFRPVLIAGRSTLRLPDMVPGSVVHVRLRPWNDPSHHTYTQTLLHAYGDTQLLSADTGNISDDSLLSRIRNAVNALPETNIVSMLGEVTLVGWTDQSLTGLSLSGLNPQHRNLTMLAKSVTVSFPTTAFRLRTGTFGASLAEVRPALPHYPCCNPSPQAIYMGAGGSATFEFDLPAASRSRFRSLSLSVYAGGPDASYTGYTDIASGAGQAFDWRGLKWVSLSFRNGVAQVTEPSRFISPTGTLLVRLRTLDDSHELTITDPHQDLQISGIAERK